MFRCLAVCMAVVLLVGCAGVTEGAAAKGTVIVQDGRPRATIVVQPDEPKARQAAEAIQLYVRKMSGAELPIVVEGAPAGEEPGTLILVGHTAAAERLGVQIPSGYDASVHDDAFEEEGYVLKTLGNAIVVGGNNDGPYKGTIYAAYALLERLGCRWYFPGEWGEIVPKRDTVVVPPLDVVSRPDFPVRWIGLSGWVPCSAEERRLYNEWAVKVGFNPARMYPTVGDGFLACLLDPNEYFDEHPEYYAMDESGKRHAGKLPGGRYYDRTTMLCLSNPDVFTESVKNLRAAFAGRKRLGNVSPNGFGISPPDGTPYCYCPACRKASQNFRYPRYFDRTYQSEEFFGFAARLAREFPDKYVATMAYSLREMVPQGVDIPRNLMVMYAPIACDVLHPNDSHLWRRRDFVRNLKAWRERTPHITIYDYNPGFLTGMWVPERDVANMAVNARIYRDIDIKGMRREGRKAFMQTWISYYATAKLLWDADTDVEALKRDFYTTFFGPQAGPHVQAWWDECEEALYNSPMQAHEDFLVNHIYTLDFARRIQRHVEAARACKMTPEQRARFDAFSLIADHFMACAEMYEAEKNLDYAAASAAAQRMIDLENKLSSIYSFFITVGPDWDRRPYFAGGRKALFDRLAAMTDGTKGVMVAPLPLEMKFRRDPFNEGVIGGWYRMDFDDSDWGTENTFYFWEQQDPPLDEAGHHYDGYGWYRATFEVPAEMAGREFRFWCGGTVNEGWVWINGRYAGHQPRKLWWSHPHDFEMDITDLVRPGERNLIAIRVWKDPDIGGMLRRGFIWSPNP